MQSLTWILIEIQKNSGYSKELSLNDLQIDYL